jgi:PPOX class probable FMN-dependent enzyme
MADSDFITTEIELRAIYGEPAKLPAAAKSDRLDDLCRRFIAESSFVCIGSSDASGRQDVSPRGDHPGFVRVIDECTLVIPDRPGNRKLETLSNILANPQVAILFFIPGHDETLRIFGRARISRDAALLAHSIVHDKLPRSVIVVEIEQVYPHCGKSLRRADMWNVARYVGREKIPTLAAIGLQMAGIHDSNVEDVDVKIQQSYRTDLY